MTQDRLNDKEHDMRGIQKQSSELLSIAWQKGYQAGFDDGYATRREADRWIPVSERLPEEFESVLVCLQTQGGMSQYVSERFNDNCWSALAGRTPLAWKPLPKPYIEPLPDYADEYIREKLGESEKGGDDQ